MGLRQYQSFCLAGINGFESRIIAAGIPVSLLSLFGELDDMSYLLAA
jgi:hypothetical protein